MKINKYDYNGIIFCFPDAAEETFCAEEFFVESFEAEETDLPLTKDRNGTIEVGDVFHCALIDRKLIRTL